MTQPPIEMQTTTFTRMYTELSQWIDKAHRQNVSKAEMCLLLGYPYDHKAKLTTENLIIWRYPSLILVCDRYREVVEFRTSSYVKFIFKKCVDMNKQAQSRRKHQKRMKNMKRRCRNCAYAIDKANGLLTCNRTKAKMLADTKGCTLHKFFAEMVIQRKAEQLKKLYAGEGKIFSAPKTEK